MIYNEMMTITNHDQMFCAERQIFHRHADQSEAWQSL